MLKCPAHPNGQAVFSRQRKIGRGVYWAYCRECGKFLGTKVMDQDDLSGRSKMEFGKHAGRPLSEVPKDYLAWLLESGAGSDSWRQALKDYIGVKE